MLAFATLVSAATGLVIFALHESSYRLRALLNVAGATGKLILVGYALVSVLGGASYETRVAIGLGFDFVLRVDELSLMFLTLSTGLWFFTTLYAIGYLEGSPHRSRFFGFFSLCVTSTMGIALAGNLLTFFLFYEMLTLSTYPLVAHRGTAKAPLPTPHFRDRGHRRASRR